ncbi:Transposon TX1 uncharacterized 82 kDa protein ORF 1 [Takifugu flavidus]|uniref:Transposon TX1 uncharacterized 82 kDa protein ORF 1 n=1 Tax=Takifugu flavidus TaxID=433684 RepID=A0A5C6N0T6_9TELE|nr:Transposon TX1 uncharacterized 82 kDa protein ORF 1 [Takifugu flavidus]
MAANANLNGLSRRHGVKVGAGSVLSVEEVALAVGQEIGHSSVKSAARMNRAVVLFVEQVEQANRLVETGITVGGQFVQVTPLTRPAARITLSNVPPFVSDEFLERELSRHGKMVSPIRKLMSGCRSPLLRHVVSHRKQVHMILNNRAEEFNYRFVVRVDNFDYVLFATSSALKCFNCGEEGHLARACPNRAVPDAVEAEPATPAGPEAPQPVPAARRRRCGAEWGPAVPDGAEMQSKAEGKWSEWSGARDNVEMVVEVTGESGEAGKEIDPTGVAFEVMGGLGETGDGKSEISELGEAGEMGDMGQTGEQGVAVGDVGQETGERGAPGKMAGELGVGGMTTGEQGEVSVSTGELGEGGAGTSEGSGGVSEWRPAPAKRRRKQKNVMEDGGDRKAGWLEDAATATDNSDQEYMSDASELSNTVADSERDDLYPLSMIKNFLTKTKGMRGPDLEIYFPDKLLFIQSASHWIKHRAASDLTDPEIFQLRKHMGKARKQLRELSNKSTSL